MSQLLFHMNYCNNFLITYIVYRLIHIRCYESIILCVQRPGLLMHIQQNKWYCCYSYHPHFLHLLKKNYYAAYSDLILYQTKTAGSPHTCHFGHNICGCDHVADSLTKMDPTFLWELLSRTVGYKLTKKSTNCKHGSNVLSNKGP
jgi:hypothetical protein